MKINTKGFTLVELLAVIVILAIIALITVPIILGVINDAKKGAAEDSAYGAIKATQLAYARASESVSGEVTITFDSTGAASDGITGNPVSKNISFSGDKPKGGTIKISGDGTATVTNLEINGYYCNGKDSKVECATTPKS